MKGGHDCGRVDEGGCRGICETRRGSRESLASTSAAHFGGSRLEKVNAWAQSFTTS